MTEKLKKGSLKVGSYKLGLPLSNSYNSKTPKKLKTISEVLVLLGSAVTIIAASITLPPVVIAAGGVSVIVGRYGIKCFSE